MKLQGNQRQDTKIRDLRVFGVLREPAMGPRYIREIGHWELLENRQSLR